MHTKIKSSRNLNVKRIAPKHSEFLNDHNGSFDDSSIRKSIPEELPSLKMTSRFNSPQPESIRLEPPPEKPIKRKETMNSVSSVGSQTPSDRKLRSPKHRPMVKKKSGFSTAQRKSKDILIIVDMLKPSIFPLTDKQTRRNNLKFQNLDKCLESLENQPLFTPPSTQWKSTKVTRMKHLKKPYLTKDPLISKKSRNTLKILNFEADPKTTTSILPSGFKPKNTLPKLSPLRSPAMRHKSPPFHKANSIINESQRSLDLSSIGDLPEPLAGEAPVPFFKSQYSIGQKWIPFRKQGKMTFLRKSYKGVK